MINDEQERLTRTLSQDDYLRYQHILAEKAIIVIDFMRTRFEFGGKTVDMRVLSELIPLIPTDPIFLTFQGRCRAPLNGAIAVFANFLVMTVIFDLDGEPGPLDDAFRSYTSEGIVEASKYQQLINDFYKCTTLVTGKRIEDILTSMKP
jgi:hypothetical protein